MIKLTEGRNGKAHWFRKEDVRAVTGIKNGDHPNTRSGVRILNYDFPTFFAQEAPETVVDLLK